MSERESADVEPMSPSMRAYVDAFAAVERPESGVAPATWAAIQGELRPDPRRRLWIAAGVAVAIAAAVLLFVSGVRGALFDRGSDLAPVQAPRERVDDAVPEAVQETSSSPGGRAERAAAVPPRDPSPAAVPQAAVPLTSHAAEPSRRDTPRRSQPTAPAPVPGASETGSLAEELARFKAAKQAFDRGAFQAAISQLVRYDEDFPKGAFRREAQVLRAEALCEAGRGTEAEALRERFLVSQAGSPLASRMRAVCQRAEQPPPSPGAASDG